MQTDNQFNDKEVRKGQADNSINNEESNKSVYPYKHAEDNQTY